MRSNKIKRTRHGNAQRKNMRRKTQKRKTQRRKTQRRKTQRRKTQRRKRMKRLRGGADIGRLNVSDPTEADTGRLNVSDPAETERSGAEYRSRTYAPDIAAHEYVQQMVGYGNVSEFGGKSAKNKKRKTHQIAYLLKKCNDKLQRPAMDRDDFVNGGLTVNQINVIMSEYDVKPEWVQNIATLAFLEETKRTRNSAGEELPQDDDEALNRLSIWAKDNWQLPTKM
jgi:hypothetical protein